MTYTVHTTSKFERDIKRCKKRHLDINLLLDAVEILKENGSLPPQYHPHKLSGKYAGLWECHIQGDWLMIWSQDDTELTLLLTDTGTHADLF